MRIATIEERYIDRILIAVRTLEPVQKLTLYRSVSTSNKTVADRVNDLIKADLLHESATTTVPFTKVITLTEKGKKVAEHLVEIERILGE